MWQGREESNQILWIMASIFHQSAPRALRLGSSSRGNTAGPRAAVGLGRRSARSANGGGVRPLRALDASICLSVAQEELAFALAIAAETYLSAEKKKEETGEETNFFQPSVVIGAIILSSGLVYSRNELLGRVGLLFTSIAAFAVIGNYAKRFLDAGESASPRRSSSLSLVV